MFSIYLDLNLNSWHISTRYSSVFEGGRKLYVTQITRSATTYQRILCELTRSSSTRELIEYRVVIFRSISPSEPSTRSQRGSRRHRGGYRRSASLLNIKSERRIDTSISRRSGLWRATPLIENCKAVCGIVAVPTCTRDREKSRPRQRDARGGGTIGSGGVARRHREPASPFGDSVDLNLLRSGVVAGRSADGRTVPENQVARIRALSFARRTRVVPA